MEADKTIIRNPVRLIVVQH